MLADQAFAEDSLKSKNRVERLVAVLVCSEKWSLDVDEEARQTSLDILHSESDSRLLSVVAELAGRVFFDTANADAERAVAEVALKAKGSDSALAFIAYLSLRSISLGKADPDLFSSTVGAMDFALESQSNEESNNLREQFANEPEIDSGDIKRGRHIDWSFVGQKARVSG